MKQADAETLIERQLADRLKSEPLLWTPNCLAPEQIIALVEKAAPEAEAVSQMEHVAFCARCRREYAETVELFQLAEEVGQLKTQAEPTPAAASAATPAQAQENPASDENARERPRFSFWQKWFAPGFGFALGAAATGLLLFFLWKIPTSVQEIKLSSILMERNSQQHRADSMEQENRTLGQELAALKQRQADSSRLEKEVVRLNAQVKNQQQEAKSQQIQVARLAEAETALQQMPLPAPDWMRSRENGQIRGNSGTDAASPQIALVHPVNAAMEARQPILECRSVSGATGYQVSLEREGSNEAIPAPKPLSATRWQVTAPLVPGQVYQWAVTAQRGGEALHSPLSKFYILSESEQRSVNAARRKYAHSPLTLGVLYARLGMLAEAEQQFHTVLQSNANDPIAKRWLKDLETRRH